MEQTILTSDYNQVVYYIQVNGKKYGPYPSNTVAGTMIHSLPLTESEKAAARIVPTTTNGQQILMES